MVLNIAKGAAALCFLGLAGGLLAGPGLAHAQTGPDISQVLANSGITAAGYITGGYTAGLNKGQTLGDRIFDSNANTFELNQAALIVGKTPDEGFGGKMVLVAGSDAKILNSFYGSGAADVALFIGYLQYSHGPINIMAGRFPALSGAELALEPLNTNISRSLVLAYAQPVPLTGVRLNYKLSDKLTATVSVTNSDSFGSPAALDDNSNKAVEAGFTYVFAPGTKLAAYNYYSKESQANGGENDYVDMVASWQATRQLQFVFNGDYKKVFKSIPSSPSGYTTGADGYINYAFTDRWSASLRGEALSIHDDLARKTTDLREVTLTGTFRPVHDFRVSAEVRYDNSPDPHYPDGMSPLTGQIYSKSETELSLSATYSFGL